MKIFTTLALMAGLLVMPAARSQGADPTDLAKAAATHWLTLADTGDYAASWDQAADAFQAAIAKPKWTAAMQSVRSPLGAARSRRLRSAEYTRSLAGAPEGEYVVVQFETTFENRPGAIETVTPVKGRDGAWRVSGYFIK